MGEPVAATSADLKGHQPITEVVPLRLGDERVVTVTVSSIGRARFDALMAEHPPRDDQSGADWNVETFAPALVAACLTDPVQSEAEIRELWDSWNEAEFLPIYEAALRVNMRRRPIADVLGESAGTPSSPQS